MNRYWNRAVLIRQSVALGDESGFAVGEAVVGNQFDHL